MAKKEKLPANIRKKANGVYEARKLVNGTMISLSNSDLNALIKEFEIAKNTLSYQGNNRFKGSSILDDWFEEWFDNYKAPTIKETSIYPMKNKYTRTFGAKIGKMRLIDIRNYHIQSALKELKAEGKAVSTLKESLSRLRDCLESAKNNQLIALNPCFDIVVPWKTEKKKQRFLSVNEQNIFLEKAKVEQSWYYPMLMIMFQSGLRVGEVGGLKWSDVDFEHKVIHIKRNLQCSYNNGARRQVMNTPKTYNSYRDVPFIGNVEEMFHMQKQMQDRVKKQLGSRWRSDYDDFTDLVFTSSMGSPATRYIVEKIINRVVKSINLEESVNAAHENRTPVIMENVHPHAIRRTFCTRCFEAEMNPKVVQKIMGHATYSTTIDIYTDVMEDRMDSEVTKFNLGFDTEDN